MRQIAKYVCEKCGKEYITPEKANECENKHICLCRQYEQGIVRVNYNIKDNQQFSLTYDYMNRSLGITHYSKNLCSSEPIVDCIEINLNYCPECGRKI